MSPQHQRDLAQHKRCMSTIAELEVCLRSASGSDWVARLQTCFGQFSEALRAHFVFQESSQLYSGLSLKEPRLADRIEKLRHDHVEILHEADLVTAQIGLLQAGTRAGAGELIHRTERLLAQFQRHETAESDLLQTAHLREVGAGD